MEKIFIDYEKLGELVRAARMMAASRWLEESARKSRSPAEGDKLPESGMLTMGGLAKAMTTLGFPTTAGMVSHWENGDTRMPLEAFIAMVTATRPPRGFRFFDQAFDPESWALIEAAFCGG